MPRFVILEHTPGAASTRSLHWDLMFECGVVLRTWALPALLSQQMTELEAAQLADHRAIYLEYEGPVSGERGTVRRVAQGTFTLIAESPERWEAVLQGETLNGHLLLERMNKSGEDPSEPPWRLQWSPVGG